MRTARLLTVSQHALGRGGVSQHALGREVSAAGGCLPRGYLPEGGVSAWRGVCPGRWPHPPPWMEWLTDRCKNITLPTSLRAVIIYLPWGWRLPRGKSWIRHCTPLLKYTLFNTSVFDTAITQTFQMVWVLRLMADGFSLNTSWIHGLFIWLYNNALPCM